MGSWSWRGRGNKQDQDVQLNKKALVFTSRKGLYRELERSWQREWISRTRDGAHPKAKRRGRGG